MRIAGFDCSSTTIGYSILDIDDTNNISLVNSGFIKPDKTGNITERLVKTRSKIKQIIELYKPDNIAIEEIIQFMQGKSTAKTIIMLTTFNRMLCLAAFDFTNKSPELFNVMSIRHGLKLNKDLPKKEDMPELVSKHLGIKFPYIKDKKGKIKSESFDMADGIAVALYYSFILTNRIKIKK